MNPSIDRMNLEFQRARRLAERGEWAESSDAYENARKMAEELGATESARQAAVFRDAMDANANQRFDQ